MGAHASDGSQRLQLGVLKTCQQQQQVALLINQRLAMPLRATILYHRHLMLRLQYS